MAQDATASAHAGSWSYDLYMWFKSHMNYGTIVLLMAIESSIIPLPSEVATTSRTSRTS